MFLIIIGVIFQIVIILLWAAWPRYSDYPPVPYWEPEERLLPKSDAVSTEGLIQVCRKVIHSQHSIQRLEDIDVVRGVCVTSAASVLLIGRGQDPTQICPEATLKMMQEFKYRWPNVDYTLFSRENNIRC